MTSQHSKVPRRIRPGASPRRSGAIALAFAAVLVSPLAAQDSIPGTSHDSTDITSSIVVPERREVLPSVGTPFRPGESLRFSVQYGPIKAGSAWLEVPESKELNGRPVLSLVARAESNAFFSRFYKVKNRIESWWDREGLYSLRYQENRREGGYKTKSEIVFDYEKSEAHYGDGANFPISNHVQDALSSFYYTRTQALPLGGSIVFDYHASKKSQPLEVRVLGREKVQTPAGSFQCVAIEPILKAGGIFKNKGRLVIWITDDERRMPVMMKSKVAIGSISVILQEYRSGA